MVLRYVGAVAVPGACVRVPVPREAVGPDGTVTDPGIRSALGAALTALADTALGNHSAGRHGAGHAGCPCLGTGQRGEQGLNAAY